MSVRLSLLLFAGFPHLDQRHRQQLILRSTPALLQLIHFTLLYVRKGTHSIMSTSERRAWRDTVAPAAKKHFLVESLASQDELHIINPSVLHQSLFDDCTLRYEDNRTGSGFR